MADLNVVLQRSCYLSADTDTPVGHGLTQTAGPAVSCQVAGPGQPPAVGGTNKEPELGTVVFIPATAAHSSASDCFVDTDRDTRQFER